MAKRSRTLQILKWLLAIVLVLVVWGVFRLGGIDSPYGPSITFREDINGLYQPVLASFQLSLSVFTSGDITMARTLLARKYKFTN